MTSRPRAQRRDIVRSFARAERPVILLDFDGVLSTIVEVPDEARPVDGAVEVLADLAERAHRVAVISGRPVDFLVTALGEVVDRLTVIGHSGLQIRTGSGVRVSDRIQDHYPTMRRAYDEAARSLVAGIHLEDKDLTFALHFRSRPDLEPAALELARRVVDGTGLLVTPGKMHYEIRIPVETDKGTAATDILTDDVDWALFAGDDDVDLPAFRVLERAEIATRFRVAVGSRDTAVHILAEADYIEDDPAGFVHTLRLLADARA